MLADEKNYRGFVLSAKRMLLDMSVQCLIDNCNLIKLHIDKCGVLTNVVKRDIIMM